MNSIKISVYSGVQICIKNWRKWIKSTITIILLGIILNLVDFLLYYAFSEKYKYCYSPPLISMMCELLLVALVIFEKRNRESKTWLVRIFILLKKVVWIVLLVTIVIKVINLGTGTISNPLLLEYGGFHLRLRYRVVYMIISIINVFYDCGVLAITWSFKTKLNSSLFPFSFILQFIIGISELQVTARNIISKPNELAPYNCLYLFVSSLTISGALIGFIITVTMAKHSKYNPVIRSAVHFLIFYDIILTILIATTFGSSIYFSQTHGKYIKALAVLFGCSFFINLGTIWSSKIVLIRVPLEFCAEKINLAELKPYQKMAYAKLISSNTRSNPGVSGEEILSLMETYTKANLKNLSTVVLRIYNPRKLGSSNNGPSNRHFSQYFQGYDEKYFFENTEEDRSEEVLKSLKPMSKNQRKREMKKAAKSKTFNTKKENSGPSFEEETNFYNDLACTEALVFLTIADNYDITSSIPGFAGKFLSACFGENSWSKLLCIRCGILGFHWPFRRAVFFCSSSKKPTIRNALVMIAVSKFNASQKKRCTILIDPMYKNSISEKSIQLSKWINIPLPSSNIIDLRPHKGKRPKQYFKDVKYRVQSESFLNKGGIVVNEMDPTSRSCLDAYNLWSNIAMSREQKGKSSYFVNPDSAFFESLLANSNTYGSRSLLFLKVDNTIIASCVLFRLGDTITSDLQGLDYEHGRKYSAYFVMMEKVIEIALNEGKSYVDFGPTTDESKQSIGASPVQLEGALFTPIPFISGFIKFAAEKVNV